jgi:hypothetical protein
MTDDKIVLKNKVHLPINHVSIPKPWCGKGFRNPPLE